MMCMFFELSFSLLVLGGKCTEATTDFMLKALQNYVYVRKLIVLVVFDYHLAYRSIIAYNMNMSNEFIQINEEKR